MDLLDEVGVGNGRICFRSDCGEGARLPRLLPLVAFTVLKLVPPRALISDSWSIRVPSPRNASSKSIPDARLLVLLLLASAEAEGRRPAGNAVGGAGARDEVGLLRL